MENSFNSDDMKEIDCATLRGFFEWIYITKINRAVKKDETIFLSIFQLRENGKRRKTYYWLTFDLRKLNNYLWGFSHSFNYENHEVQYKACLENLKISQVSNIILQRVTNRNSGAGISQVRGLSWGVLSNACLSFPVFTQMEDSFESDNRKEIYCATFRGFFECIYITKINRVVRKY